MDAVFEVGAPLPDLSISTGPFPGFENGRWAMNPDKIDEMSCQEPGAVLEPALILDDVLDEQAEILVQRAMSRPSMDGGLAEERGNHCHDTRYGVDSGSSETTPSPTWPRSRSP